MIARPDSAISALAWIQTEGRRRVQWGCCSIVRKARQPDLPHWTDFILDRKHSCGLREIVLPGRSGTFRDAPCSETL